MFVFFLILLIFFGRLSQPPILPLRRVMSNGGHHLTSTHQATSTATVFCPRSVSKNVFFFAYLLTSFIDIGSGSTQGGQVLVGT